MEQKCNENILLPLCEKRITKREMKKKCTVVFHFLQLIVVASLFAKIFSFS
jgi:hypothetical protein